MSECGQIGVSKRGSERCAFTMIEIVVTIGVLALLLGILLPGITGAREQGKGTMCRAQLSELLRANTYYAMEQGDRYCPGAADFQQNLHRWHGSRMKAGLPFGAQGGPLSPYLGAEHQIRQCPTFPIDEAMQTKHAFERGAGGYGYNGVYIGAATLRQGLDAVTILDDRMGARRSDVRRPADTLMFADAAIAAPGLIEYSFAEPRFQPIDPTRRPDPSIHFRHARRANVGWCDGHVDQRARTFTWSSGVYGKNADRMAIGWFGESDDNVYFDLQ